MTRTIKNINTLLFTLATLFFVTACTGAGIGTLTPWNQATYIPARPPTGQELYMQMDGLMTPTALNGKVKINMPDGEILNGEYSFLHRGKIGYGKLYSLSYGFTGAGDPNTVYLEPDATRLRTGSFGEISALGNKGTSIRCEFFYQTAHNSPIGEGWGVCKTSKGELYRFGIK